jgi:hypothetical protein
MATEVGADPRELIRLAGTYLSESRRLGDALHGAQTFAVPTATAFGDTAGGAGLHSANDELAELAGLAVGRLVEVLEGDVDRLHQLAFVYEQADRQASTDRPRPGHGGPTAW